MNLILSKQERTSIPGNGFDWILPVLVIAYALFFSPFLFTYMLNETVRIGLEGLIVFLLIIFTLFLNRRISKYFFIFIGLSIMISILVQGDKVNNFSSLNKIIFFLLLGQYLFMNYKFAEILKWLYLAFWTFQVCEAVLAFFLFTFHLAPFREAGIYANTGIRYHYLSFYFLGNIAAIKAILGITVNRIAGYVFEPIMFAFFCGLNVLSANIFFKPGRNKNVFRFINLLGVIFSFSFGGIFTLFIAILFKKYIKGALEKTRNILIIVIIFVMGVFLIAGFGFMDKLLFYSSFDIRMMKILKGLELFKQIDLKSLLFGFGIIKANTFVGGQIDSGLINIILSRGLILSILILTIIIKYLKTNSETLIYLLVYSLFLEVFWYPMFWLHLSLLYYFSRKHAMNEKYFTVNNGFADSKLKYLTI